MRLGFFVFCLTLLINEWYIVIKDMWLTVINFQASGIF